MTKQELVMCAQLDMLEEVDRICRNNDISYFLVGGTLLGAIRHNGFIPWDDDIDIGMLRKDYERFVITCKDELRDEFKLYDWNNDKNAAAAFTKMKIEGTHYQEALSKNVNTNDGIFIDIFPLDNAPDSKFLQKIQGIKRMFIIKTILINGGFAVGEGSKYKKFVYTVLKKMTTRRDLNQWKDDFIRNAKKYSDIETSKVVNLCGTYSYKRELKDKEMFLHLINHCFENLSVKIPAEYDKYLTEVYGNYMELPPEDKRISRHGIINIDLGEYKVKNTLHHSANTK